MPPSINNAFYSDLGDRWFEGDTHAVALLRVEAAIKVRYVLEVLERLGIAPGARVLDVACGAGLVAFPLAERGYRIKGVDLAEGAVEAARRHVPEGVDATFAVADAYATGEPGGHYDVVLLLDMLEHVERPEDVLREAARVVRPGGLVVFHTFNRTPEAWLLAVHGVRFVARETPDHLHVFNLFIRPASLKHMAAGVGLDVREVRGVRPVLNRAFWWSLLHRRVHPGFRFTFAGAPRVGYAGYAVKGEG